MRRFVLIQRRGGRVWVVRSFVPFPDQAVIWAEEDVDEPSGDRVLRRVCIQADEVGSESGFLPNILFQTEETV